MLTTILDHLGQYLTSQQRQSVRSAFDETCAPSQPCAHPHALHTSPHCLQALVSDQFPSVSISAPYI